MKDLTPILSIMFAVGLSIIFIVVWRIRNRRSDEEEKVRQASLVEEGIRSGALTADGARACIVCGAQATEYSPMSAASWMDQLPLLNRLFSLPPRYVIVDDLAGDFRVCRLHKSVAVKKLEEFHALLRAERARFNAAQAEKVAQMDGGGLFQIVEDQHRTAVRSLRSVNVTPMPRLEMAHPDPEPSVTLVTASGPDKAADAS
jgi:hypothetical protein